ncbi:lymphocyte antigen 6E-like [Gadus macrocephalus]|uniref:lymphocyte antigen 6E-like n=1 Tax=Gadus macrocephalus TaxID=80720 RepID=UPI0028CB77B9|nr:lymphocyte antigen 6E-like [Gadus macrocephalus]
MGYVCILFVLSLTISTVGGLRCFACISGDYLSCFKPVECPSSMDRCFTTGLGDTLIKGCQFSSLCALPGTGCCQGDLCNFANSSNSIGSSFILLLLSTAALYFL